jgi:hypothetical protein
MQKNAVVNNAQRPESLEDVKRERETLHSMLLGVDIETT